MACSVMRQSSTEHGRCNHLPPRFDNRTCQDFSCSTSEDVKISAGRSPGMNAARLSDPAFYPRPRKSVLVSLQDDLVADIPRKGGALTEMRSVRQTVLKPVRKNGRLVLKEKNYTSKQAPASWQSYQAIHPLGTTRRRSHVEDSDACSRSKHRWSLELASLPPLILHQISSPDSPICTPQEIDGLSKATRHLFPDFGDVGEVPEETSHHLTSLHRSVSLPSVTLLPHRSSVASGTSRMRPVITTDLAGLVNAASKNIEFHRPRSRLRPSEPLCIE